LGNYALSCAALDLLPTVNGMTDIRAMNVLKVALGGIINNIAAINPTWLARSPRSRAIVSDCRRTLRRTLWRPAPAMPKNSRPHRSAHSSTQWERE
jgi:hypothetical protein